jgi:hypothetical protein
MGKASSSKKVARAASTGGGRTVRGRQPLLYWAVIVLTVVLGTAGVVASRNQRLHSISANGATPPRAGKDHWHVAYGTYICDHFEPSIPNNNEDPFGIHTHGDGIIHVHPYVNSAAGKNAVLGQFAKTMHMTLNAGELHVPARKDYKDGDAACPGKPGRVEVQIFNSLADTTGHLAKIDPSQIPLKNGQLLTIAFVPKGTRLPPPPSGPTLNNLSDVARATTTTTAPPVVPLTGTSAPAGATSTTGAPPTTTVSTTPATTATTVKH